MGGEEEGVKVGRRGRRGKGWEKRTKGYRLGGEEEGVKVGKVCQWVRVSRCVCANVCTCQSKWSVSITFIHV